ncbi:SLC6A1 [Mytilus coruscus]|uniref:SLC6A1 n=1 Tax=Mytilus coruscus TaxID=42192 RepID=A0A6J8A6Y5_MYTCO|nr:SLC6A1 [Mytilus coruscus]
MADIKGMHVADVVDHGPGLAFVAYPEAISTFPVSPLWVVLFFLMMLTIGIDTQFGTIETIHSALVDEYPKLLRNRKTLFMNAICCVGFISGIPFIMNLMIVFNMIQFTPVSYGTYMYPSWAVGAGWIIGFVSVIPIPLYIIKDLWSTEGTILQRIKTRLTSESDYGPALEVNCIKPVELLRLTTTERLVNHSSKQPELFEEQKKYDLNKYNCQAVKECELQVVFKMFLDLSNFIVGFLKNKSKDPKENLTTKMFIGLPDALDFVNE